LATPAGITQERHPERSVILNAAKDLRCPWAGLDSSLRSE